MYQIQKYNFTDIINYLKDKKDTFQMLLVLVNLGINIQNFNQSFYKKYSTEFKKIFGKPLPDNIDSRYIQVGRDKNNTLDFLPIEDHPNSDVNFDEFVVKNIYQALTSYVLIFTVVHKLLIWRDSNLSNDENTKHFNEIKKSFSDQLTFYGVDKDETAFEIIDRKYEKDSIYIISNRANEGREFLEKYQK
jgi:hypothetical protein